MKTIYVVTYRDPSEQDNASCVEETFKEVVIEGPRP